MTIPESILSVATVLFSSEPALLALQIGAIALSAITIYTVLLTTKDVIARSSSVLFQVTSIVLSAVLPIAGFFLYLLIRPTTTVQERALRKDLTEVLVRLREMSAGNMPQEKKEKIQKYVKKSLAKDSKKKEEKKDEVKAL